ncbi:hypothetical protein AVEN_28327-1 [Araneus ventricosus]|uniref:Uncharacterized protein n=1 Tax=Araneus ventricosus TaxID=182803 RepID=A0A4Y2DKI8_ARAVE|nr:hypothetical protein AVEN_28327-1 [Araneus ventricosus]
MELVYVNKSAEGEPIPLVWCGSLRRLWYLSLSIIFPNLTTVLRIAGKSKHNNEASGGVYLRSAESLGLRRVYHIQSYAVTKLMVELKFDNPNILMISSPR